MTEPKAIEVMSDQYVKLMRLLAENRRLQTELNTAISEAAMLRAAVDRSELSRLSSHGAFTHAAERAERAEATLAAIREVVTPMFLRDGVSYDEAADALRDVLALLDAAPKETP